MSSRPGIPVEARAFESNEVAMQNSPDQRLSVVTCRGRLHKPRMPDSGTRPHVSELAPPNVHKKREFHPQKCVGSRRQCYRVRGILTDAIAVAEPGLARHVDSFSEAGPSHGAER